MKAQPGEPRCHITLRQDWHPDMGWGPEGAIRTDEPWHYVDDALARGASWVRVHSHGRELHINFAHVVCIEVEQVADV